MNKPIPHEIMREARGIAECSLKAGTIDCDVLEGSIARALLARDERAADLHRAVKQYLREHDNPAPDYAYRHTVRERMRKAIATYDGASNAE